MCLESRSGSTLCVQWRFFAFSSCLMCILFYSGGETNGITCVKCTLCVLVFCSLAGICFGFLLFGFLLLVSYYFFLNNDVFPPDRVVWNGTVTNVNLELSIPGQVPVYVSPSPSEQCHLKVNRHRQRFWHKENGRPE